MGSPRSKRSTRVGGRYRRPLNSERVRKLAKPIKKDKLRPERGGQEEGNGQAIMRLKVRFD